MYRAGAMPRCSLRQTLVLFGLVTFVLWTVAHILRPTLAGRMIRQFSPLYNDFPSDAFDFTRPRPEWLVPPSPEQNKTTPLVLRIAVITHPSEVDRRTAIRESIFADVPSNEVSFQYKFFVGRAPGKRLHVWSTQTLDEIVDEEQTVHQDMEILDMKESSSGLGMKRHAALHWV
jgi:hypothetical protein